MESTVLESTRWNDQSALRYITMNAQLITSQSNYLNENDGIRCVFFGLESSISFMLKTDFNISPLELDGRRKSFHQSRNRNPIVIATDEKEYRNRKN